MRKIKIGILGVSNHLLKRIVLPLQNTANCELVAIASRSMDKAKQFAKDFNIEKSFDSYQKLIDDKNVEAVYIPLPNHMHAEWIEKAAKAGKHILCEKPLTLDASEAQQSINHCQKHQVKLMEAFMYKFHPQWMHIKNIIRTNQIGKIKYINIAFAYNNPQSTNIRNIREYGGGAIMDIGCYAISVPRFLLDKEPQKVIALCEYHREFKTDTLSTGILDFGDCRSTFNISTLSHPNQGVEIVGTSGTIKVTVPFNTYVDIKSEIIISTPQGERNISFDICDQYGLMFEAFSESVLQDTNPPVDPDDAVKNMKVIDAIFRSSKSSSWETI
ncbi:Gfo/Idh/MocA family oxidoreductase [Labilibacter sediminis]|nr:Gfo/Idh/MocA family oxidoreductase [Labilibacter sediminis]